MMKTILSVVMLLSAVPAFAHLEPGTYAGVDNGGGPCTFEVVAIRFDGVRHPLNERVEIQVAGTSVILAHLPMIDTRAGTVRPDSEHLSSANGISGGAFGVVLKMSHEEGHEGPVSLTMIRDDYKNPAASATLVCGELKHIE